MQTAGSCTISHMNCSYSSDTMLLPRSQSKANKCFWSQVCPSSVTQRNRGTEGCGHLEDSSEGNTEVRIKVICTTCQSRHQQNLKSLELNLIITWDNQNEKSLSRVILMKAFFSLLIAKSFLCFVTFANRWQLCISHNKSVQYVFIIQSKNWLEINIY